MKRTRVEDDNAATLCATITMLGDDHVVVLRDKKYPPKSLKHIPTAQMTTFVEIDGRSHWYVSCEDYAQVRQTWLHDGLALLEDIPKVLLGCVLDYIRRRKLALSSLATPILPHRLYHRLYPHQQTILDFLRTIGNRGANYSEQGTGKTPLGVAFLADCPRPAVIVCPASVVGVWKRELATFGDLSAVVVTKKQAVDPLGISIVSYGAIDKIDSVAATVGTVVLDECHYVKTSGSRRTKQCTQLTANASHVLLLSGTPSCRPSDLYSQLHMIAPRVFSDFYPAAGYRKPQLHHSNLQDPNHTFYFAERYCAPTITYLGRGKHVHVFAGTSRAWELHAILQCFSRRILKTDALIAPLPEKVRIETLIGDVHGPAAETKLCEAAFAEIARVTDTLGKQAGNVLISAEVRANSLRKITYTCQYLHRTLDAVLLLPETTAPSSTSSTSGILNHDDSAFATASTILSSTPIETCGTATPTDGDIPNVPSEILQRIPKMIIFGHFKSTLRAVERVLTERGLRYVTIDGAVTGPARSNRVASFQADPDIRFAVMSIRAAGVGLTLVAATEVLFADLVWSINDMVQAEDRVHRIGQLSEVNIRYLIHAGSIDVTVWRSLQRKSLTSSMIVDNNKSKIKFDQSEQVHVDTRDTSIPLLEKKKPRLEKSSASDIVRASAFSGWRLDTQSTKVFNLGVE